MDQNLWVGNAGLPSFASRPRFIQPILYQLYVLGFILFGYVYDMPEGGDYVNVDASRSRHCYPSSPMVFWKDIRLIKNNKKYSFIHVSSRVAHEYQSEGAEKGRLSYTARLRFRDNVLMQSCT